MDPESSLSLTYSDMLAAEMTKESVLLEELRMKMEEARVEHGFYDPVEGPFLHFTNAEALLSILGREKLTLWSTDSRFLNDEREVVTTDEIGSHFHRDHRGPASA